MALGVKNASGGTIVLTVMKSALTADLHYVVFTDTEEEARDITMDEFSWAGGATLPNDKWTTVDEIHGFIKIFDFVGLRFLSQQAPDGTPFIVALSGATSPPN